MWYDSLKASGPNPLGNPATFKKGAVTWLSPQNYQVHQLDNTDDEVCVTITCYRYISVIPLTQSGQG
jgi:hypothetical protein